jgi:thiol-disulfide isomerase/thioredoxin
MKKLLRGLLLVVAMFAFVSTVSAKNKVNLYLFRREGCPHCQDELVYLDKIINKYKDKINIVVYDVTKGGNAQLIEDVANTLKYQINGVPFTLIGSSYLEGFGAGLEGQLTALIEKGYDEQPDDIVESLLDENIYENLISTDLYDAMEEENLEITSKKSKQNNIIPIIVFGSIFIAVGALIYYSRKK